MSIRATNRRERIRMPDGSRVDLPGGDPETGLSAVARLTLESRAITGAGRAAPFADSIEPYAAATVVMERALDVPGVTLAGAVLTSTRANSTWGQAYLDVSRLDTGAEVDDASGSGPTLITGAVPVRAALNPEADPAGDAWFVTQHHFRTNLHPDPSYQNLSITPTWWYHTPDAAGPAVVVYPVRTTTTPRTGTHRLSLTLPSAGLAVLEDGVAGWAQAGTYSVSVYARGPVGSTVQLLVTGATETGFSDSGVVPMDGTWQRVEVVLTALDGAGVSYRLRARGPSGAEFGFDDWLIEPGYTAMGSFTAGSPAAEGTSYGRLFAPQDFGPSIGYPTPTPLAYSTPTVTDFPLLDLPGDLRAHTFTGPIGTGDVLMSPWSWSGYRPMPGRAFTVAGWAKVTQSGGVTLTMVPVIEMASPSGATVYRLEGPPVQVDGVARRFVATVTAPDTLAWRDFLATGADIDWRNRIRVGLRVDARSVATVAGTTVQLRGVHAYAGPDRGDAVGLRAVTLGDPILQIFEMPEGYPGIVANRVDIHGSDELGHITAATVQSSVFEETAYYGDSPGRLTVRAPAGYSELMTTVRVYLEEAATGTGDVVALQLVDPMYEVDATADLMSLAIERASDADPSDSTTPVGNYAASSCDLVLDDSAERWSLFRRQYIDTEHRIEAATGVVYTNRHDDPSGVESAVSWLPTSYIPNGTFETDTTGWQAAGSATLSRVTTPVHSGTGALRCVATAANAGTSHVVGSIPALTAGQYARLEVWVQAPAGAPMQLYAQEYTAVSPTLVATSTAVFEGIGEWQLVVVDHEVVGASSKVRPAVVALASGSTTFYVDDVTARAGNLSGLGWDGGGMVAVTPDASGLVPPGAVRMLPTAAQSGGPYVTGVPGSRWSVTVWARHESGAAGSLTFLGAAGGPVTVPVASGWAPYTQTVTLPAGSPGPRVTGARALLASPTIERLDDATGLPVEVVETAPAGTFYTRGWPGGSGHPEVSLSGVDIMGRQAGVAYEEPVPQGSTSIEAQVRRVAREYLDLGADQVVVQDPLTPLSLATPTATVGQMLADLAKAGALTAYTDGAGRLVALSRQLTETESSVVYDADNKLVRARTAIEGESVVNEVTITAHPIVAQTARVVATAARAVPPPSPGVFEPEDGDFRVDNYAELIIPFPDVVAVRDATVTVYLAFLSDVGVSAPRYIRTLPPGTDNVSGVIVERYPTFVKLTLSGYVAPTWLMHASVSGVPLVDSPISTRYTRAASVARYGRRAVEVDLRLGQSPESLSTVAEDILDGYSLRTAAGVRILPDLEVETLGDPWREVGDRVAVSSPDDAIVGEYRVVAHRYEHGRGTASSLHLRSLVGDVAYGYIDVSLTDDGAHVA